MYMPAFTAKEPCRKIKDKYNIHAYVMCTHEKYNSYIPAGHSALSGSTTQLGEGNRDEETREWLGEEERSHRVTVGGGGETSFGSTAQ